MEKSKGSMSTDPNYKWWDDPYLWSEDDGEDLEDREMTDEERQMFEELFKKQK